MQKVVHLQITWQIRKVSIFSVCCLLCFISCHDKAGDPSKFTTLDYDQITEKNAPAGIVVRDGKVQLADGYSIVYSPDSTKALMVSTGTKPGGGTTAMRCDCDGLIKLGCIIGSKDIITCIPILCNSCKPVLQVYDGFVSVEKFRSSKKE